MRAGGCTVQQALTAEAASVVKQAVALAKQRGHAQVTPLHVANTMLAASTGLLRKACLQSHSHPLQCRALELCFNVALNRLPASSSSPMLGPHSQHPSISNALVAAFKRAQAHQRRGSIENQQQPLLAVKIELEQLIISILDDPSVSRVMREAGFSSTKVKSNVEQAISLELCSRTPPSSNNKSNENNLSALSTQPSSNSESLVKVTKPNASDHALVKHEDVISLIESFMNRRKKSIVIVGECVDSIESIVRSMMDKVDKGNVPEAMREVQFISIPFSSVANQRREEVEQKIGELTCLVRSLLAKGVVLYLGDLKWVVDYRDNNGEQRRRNYYCPVDHMIMELGRLVFAFGESGNFRLMGIATFQTYMRCRTGHNSLESVWGLHPVTMPAGSLELSLIPDSDNQGDSKNKKAKNGSCDQLVLDKGEEKQLSCCADCSAKFEAEVRNLQMMRSNSESTLSSLPSWLKDESKSFFNSNDQRCASVKELCEKWNSICSAVHKQSKSLERALTFPSSSSPSSSNSCFSYDQPYRNMQQTHLPSFEPVQPWRDHQVSTPALYSIASKTSFRMYMSENISSTQAFSLNPNPIYNSSSSSETMEMEYIQRFKEFNAENLNILCEAMEKKVPWQKEIIPEIAGTLLQCRSGMLRRKGKATTGESTKKETWLIFQGQDAHAKEQIARELARVVFGSYSKFISIALSSFSSTRADSSEDPRNKRSRDEQSCSYIERFAQAASMNPHRVFFMEDVEQADYCSQKGIKRAIQRGKITNYGGEEVSLCDAIIIVSCESFNSRSRACSPSVKQKLDGSEEEELEAYPTVSLDLNICLDDHDSIENQSIDDIGLLENVDRRIVFRVAGE